MVVGEGVVFGQIADFFFFSPDFDEAGRSANSEASPLLSCTMPSRILISVVLPAPVLTEYEP